MQSKGFDLSVNFFASLLTRRDDLGRVVLPKEIRKTMRIREGDPLEIFTDDSGGIIFKKYSQMETSGEIVATLCDAVCKAGSFPCVICDRSRIVASAGIKGSISSSHISPQLENAMSARTAEKLSSPQPLTEDSDEQFCAVAPVVTGGDIVGAVAVVGDRCDDIGLIKLAAVFLSKFFE